MKTNNVVIGLIMIFIGVGLILGGIVGAIIANPGPLPVITFENIFIYYIMFLFGIIVLIGGIILLIIGIIKKYKKLRYQQSL